MILPRRSQIAPPSPSVNYDDLPSPRRRKSTVGVNYNPAPQYASSSTPAPRKVGNVIHSPPPDDLNVGRDELDESITMPTTTKKRDRVTNGDGDEGDEEDGVEMGRKADARLSMVSRKSTGRGVVEPDADTDDEAPSELGAPSFRYDGNTGVDDGDLGLGSDDGEDGDAGLEKEAVAAEEGSEEEAAAPNEPERHPRPTARNGKRRVDPPPAKVLAKKRRTRLSRLDNGPSCPFVLAGGNLILRTDDEDGVHGDFVSRRSGRQHFKPLAYWRGEKFEYTRGPALPVIKEVVHIPPEYVEPFAAQRKRGRTGRSQSVRRGHGNGGSGRGSDEPEEAGWDEGTNPVGVVKDPSGRELYRRE